MLLAQVLVDDVSHSSLNHPVCNPTVESHQIFFRHDLPLVNPCWQSPITFLFSLHHFQNNLLHHLARNRSISGSFFLPILKMGLMFPLYMYMCVYVSVFYTYIKSLFMHTCAHYYRKLVFIQILSNYQC